MISRLRNSESQGRLVINLEQMLFDLKARIYW